MQPATAHTEQQHLKAQADATLADGMRLEKDNQFDAALPAFQKAITLYEQASDQLGPILFR
jgi:hypothetical protein